MDLNIVNPPYPIFNIGAPQPDLNIDTSDRTEYCYATFIGAIMSTLAKVSLHSFQNKTESTIHLEIRTNPVTHGGTKARKPSNIIVLRALVPPWVTGLVLIFLMDC